MKKQQIHPNAKRPKSFSKMTLLLSGIIGGCTQYPPHVPLNQTSIIQRTPHTEIVGEDECKLPGRKAKVFQNPHGYLFDAKLCGGVEINLKWNQNGLAPHDYVLPSAQLQSCAIQFFSFIAACPGDTLVIKTQQMELRVNGFKGGQVDTEISIDRLFASEDAKVSFLGALVVARLSLMSSGIPGFPQDVCGAHDCVVIRVPPTTP